MPYRPIEFTLGNSDSNRWDEVTIRQAEDRMHRVGEPVAAAEMVEDNLSHLRSDRNKAIIAANPPPAQTYHCEMCQCEMNSTEAYVYRRTGDGSRRWFCEKHYHERFASCEGCNTTVDTQASGARQWEDQYGGIQHYCNRCYDRAFATCSECDTRVPQNTMRQSPYGDMFCRACYERLCAASRVREFGFSAGGPLGS